MDPGGLSALSWRSMTGRMINSQSTLKLCRICCSSWILANPWGLTEFTPESSKTWLMSLQDLSWWFLGIQRGPSWLEASECCPDFQERQEAGSQKLQACQSHRNKTKNKQNPEQATNNQRNTKLRNWQLIGNKKTLPVCLSTGKHISRVEAKENRNIWLDLVGFNNDSSNRLLKFS